MQNEFIDEEIEIVVHPQNVDYTSRGKAISKETLTTNQTTTFTKQCIVILIACLCVAGTKLFLFNDQPLIVTNQNERKLQSELSGMPMTQWEEAIEKMELEEVEKEMRLSLERGTESRINELKLFQLLCRKEETFGPSVKETKALPRGDSRNQEERANASDDGAREKKQRSGKKEKSKEVTKALPAAKFYFWPPLQGELRKIKKGDYVYGQLTNFKWLEVMKMDKTSVTCGSGEDEYELPKISDDTEHDDESGETIPLEDIPALMEIFARISTGIMTETTYVSGDKYCSIHLELPEDPAKFTVQMREAMMNDIMQRTKKHRIYNEVTYCVTKAMAWTKEQNGKGETNEMLQSNTGTDSKTGLHITIQQKDGASGQEFEQFKKKYLGDAVAVSYNQFEQGAKIKRGTKKLNLDFSEAQIDVSQIKVRIEKKLSNVMSDMDKRDQLNAVDGFYKIKNGNVVLTNVKIVGEEDATKLLKELHVTLMPFGAKVKQNWNEKESDEKMKPLEEIEQLAAIIEELPKQGRLIEGEPVPGQRVHWRIELDESFTQSLEEMRKITMDYIKTQWSEGNVILEKLERQGQEWSQWTELDDKYTKEFMFNYGAQHKAHITVKTEKLGKPLRKFEEWQKENKWTKNDKKTMHLNFDNAYLAIIEKNHEGKSLAKIIGGGRELQDGSHEIGAGYVVLKGIRIEEDKRCLMSHPHITICPIGVRMKPRRMMLRGENIEDEPI